MKTVKAVATYSCKKIVIAFGSHVVTGVDNDSFLTIAKQGDGVTSNVGAFGDIERSMDPNDQYKISLTLMWSSPTNDFLQEQYDYDNESCEGMFPVLIKDLRGKTLFQADEAWVVKPADRAYGKAAPNRAWEIDTGSGAFTKE